jgi:hypothetical protein
MTSTCPSQTARSKAQVQFAGKESTRGSARSNMTGASCPYSLDNRIAYFSLFDKSTHVSPSSACHYYNYWIGHSKCAVVKSFNRIGSGVRLIQSLPCLPLNYSQLTMGDNLTNIVDVVGNQFALKEDGSGEFLVHTP